MKKKNLIKRSVKILREQGASSLLRRSTNKFKQKTYHPTKNWVELERDRALLRRARSKKEKQGKQSPLVSVCIPTYNRGRLLTERAIPSVLRQTYQNFEIIIVGDHCTDNTEELLKKIDDKRIRFHNLSKRGDYPTDPMSRWRVAGVVPANKSLDLSSGQWIAPLDDDDEFTDDHIEVLLNHALKNDYEMVYGIVELEKEPGVWTTVGSYPLRHAQITRDSALYHSKLKCFRYDLDAWKYEEPFDWRMWRRMKQAGVRIGFLNKIVGRYYLAKENPRPTA